MKRHTKIGWTAIALGCLIPGLVLLILLVVLPQGRATTQAIDLLYREKHLTRWVLVQDRTVADLRSMGYVVDQGWVFTTIAK